MIKRPNHRPSNVSRMYSLSWVRRSLRVSTMLLFSSGIKLEGIEILQLGLDGRGPSRLECDGQWHHVDLLWGVFGWSALEPQDHDTIRPRSAVRIKGRWAIASLEILEDVIAV